MATPVELILICLVAVALLALVARKIGVPYPILLTVAGGLLAFVPGLPTIRLDPKLVFDLFLPPLIYPAAVYTCGGTSGPTFAPFFPWRFSWSY